MERPAPYLFPLGVRLGEHNLVLHASSRTHSLNSYAGPLSIKTVLRGRVTWVIDSRELVVDPSSFLVLAAGERYSMNIDELKPVETCCAFFANGFLERIAADLTSPLEMELNAPDRIAPPLAYLSALHGDREHALTGRVCALAKRCEKALNPSCAEEDFLASPFRCLSTMSRFVHRQHVCPEFARPHGRNSSADWPRIRSLSLFRSHIARGCSARCLPFTFPLPPWFHTGFPRDTPQLPDRTPLGTSSRHNCKWLVGTRGLCSRRILKPVSV
jgi:hypothetical protein